MFWLLFSVRQMSPSNLVVGSKHTVPKCPVHRECCCGSSTLVIPLRFRLDTTLLPKRAWCSEPVLSSGEDHGLVRGLAAG